MSCTYLHVRFRNVPGLHVAVQMAKLDRPRSDGEKRAPQMKNETSMLKNLTNKPLCCSADGEAGPVSRYQSASSGRCATGVHLHQLRVPDKEPVWHQSTAATHHHLRR